MASGYSSGKLELTKASMSKLKREGYLDQGRNYNFVEKCMNGEGRWRHFLALAGDRNNECGEQKDKRRERERIGGYQELSERARHTTK